MPKYIFENFFQPEGGPVRVFPSDPTPENIQEELDQACRKIARSQRIMSVVRHYNFSDFTLYGFFIYSKDPEGVM